MFSTLLQKSLSAFSILSRPYYIGLAVVLAASTVAWLSYSYLTKPTLLRIAVGPEGSSDFRILTEFTHLLDLHRADVRVQMVPTAGLQENAAALQKGAAELAVLRADQGLPSNSSIVMILRQNFLVIVARSKLGLENFSELSGKRLGIVARSPLDEEGYAKLLTLYGMQKSDIKSRTITADQVAPLMDGDKLDAVMVLGALVDAEVSGVVYAVDRKSKNGPSILALDLAGLVDKNTLAASSDTIPARAFPRRRVPAEEVETISVPALIVAAKADGPVREKLRTQAIMELARNLIERRDELSRRLGFVTQIEAPETEKGSRLPVHAGTAAYIDSTDISWYTAFSDQIWTVWLLGGAVFSIVAGFGGFLRAPKAEPMLDFLPRLKALAEQARSGPKSEELDALSDKLIDLGDEMAVRAYEHNLDNERLAPMHFAFESARFAIQSARERQAYARRSLSLPKASARHDAECGAPDALRV